MIVIFEFIFENSHLHYSVRLLADRGCNDVYFRALGVYNLLLFSISILGLVMRLNRNWFSSSEIIPFLSF